MARTHQKRTSRSGRAGDVRRPVRLPGRSERFPQEPGLESFARLGRLSFCVLASGAAFAGGYLGLIESVEKLDEPRTYETHPTYIYSAPLSGDEDSRRVIGTIFEDQNRKTASLSEIRAPARRRGRRRRRAFQGAWRRRPLGDHARALGRHQGRGAVEGASAVARQYVKNAYLSQDRSISRKIKEALIAIEVERKQDSKDQIIADYLNSVYFGNNAYGVEAAAETYFNKSVEDLSIAESATLVGLLWSPSTSERTAMGRSISETWC